MTRYDIAFKALESHEIEADTLGQLGAHNFTDKAILMAVERHWISVEFAARLLDAEIETDDRIKTKLRKRLENYIESYRKSASNESEKAERLRRLDPQLCKSDIEKHGKQAIINEAAAEALYKLLWELNEL